MATQVILKKSSVSNKVPLDTDLEYGELALNYADGRLYYKNTSDVISQFNTTGNAGTVTDGVYTTGNQTITGLKTFSGVTSFTGAGSQLLLKNSSISDPTVIHRSDGVNYYILLSDAGTAVNGTWNALRPFSISQVDGRITSSNGQTFSGGLNTSSQVTSTVATGTAPLVVASTTRVANLNVATAGVADNVTGTNLGKTGATGFFTTTAWTSTNWSNLPIGGGGMAVANTPGAPNTNYGYFIKLGNRDAGGGWGGIWTDYSTNDTYVGNTTLSTTDATWYKLLSSTNYNTYSPTLIGTGASGTWGISVTGNAGTVTNGVYTSGNQTITGVKRFANGIISGSTQGYADYNALIDFGTDVPNTWRKIVDASLQDILYSTIGLKIDIVDAQANHATQGSQNNVRTETYYVACVRTNDTVINTPDVCYVSGPSNRIRAVKTATGVYEIQIQNESTNKEYRVEISVYAFNGTHTVVYSDGVTASAGTAQYNSAVSSTQTAFFQNIAARALTSTVTTGTAPLVVASTTRVANLNAATAGVADALNPANGYTVAGITATSSTGRISTGTDSGGNLSFGRIDNTASTPFIDFNSGATTVDFDTRIMASGGTGTAGNGSLIITSASVGIGTSTPGYKLEVNGSFAATSKSFLIPHPTKLGKKLRHGSLEGPEHGVYIRGKIKGGVIELPEYWTKLVDQDSITVQLTAIGKGQKLYVEDICDNKVYIANDGMLSSEPHCFYFIQAERIDVEKMEIEI